MKSFLSLIDLSLSFCSLIEHVNTNHIYIYIERERERGVCGGPFFASWAGLLLLYYDPMILG